MANQHANLHEMTKQLDVLTWNARSVLNALIRSAMRAGSSSGFTVQRAGETIRLTKEDIYKIYHFYEKWESLGYPNDEETFNALLAEENEYYPNGDEVTASLVKHAKTVWQDTTNKDSTDEEWINRIRMIENAKWFTNTAPIPLNIRTPIYDENLSTKTYDSYETYLFPSGYYAIDTLGYVGDGSIHTAGGNEWVFDVENRFRVNADRILLGSQDDTTVALYESLYSVKKPKRSLAGGINSGAFDECAFSYGKQNQANGQGSVTIGGTQNTVVSSYGAVIGGSNNTVAMLSGVVAGGIYNHIGGGTEGFAANSYNNIGGYSYPFLRRISSSGKETECDPTYTPTESPNCTYYLATIDATTGAGGSALGPNQFYVSKTDIDRSGIGDGNTISSGRDAGVKSPFDFKIGDLVSLYGIVVSGGLGKACKRVSAQVINISKHTAKGIVPMSDPSFADGYVVTVDKDFTVKTFTDLGNNQIISGYVTRSVAVDYPLVSDKNKFVSEYNHDCTDCSVLGYNNIAAGRGQVVVGASNIELLRPTFVIGVGSAYINAEDYHRANSFVSSEHYTYMMSSQYVVSGVSKFTTAYIHGDADWQTNQEYDEDFMHGVEKYAGFYAYSNNLDYDDEGRAVLRVFHEKSVLAIGENGLVLYEPKTAKNDQTRTVWNELYSKNGGIAIHSGSFLETGAQNVDNNWLDFYNNWTSHSTIPGTDHSITIWAKDDAGMHGENVWVHASNYISLECNALRIRGNTRAALTAQPSDYGVECFKPVAARIDTIKDSGHFYVSKQDCGMYSDADLSTAFRNVYANGYHVFASAKMVSNGTGYNMYDVAQLVIPASLATTCNRSLRGTSAIPHPMIMSNRMNHWDTDNTLDKTGRDYQLSGEGTGYLYEELAYLSDVKMMQTRVLQNISAPAYTAAYGIPCRTDLDSLVPGRIYASVQDTFLASLITTSTGYSSATGYGAYTSASNGGNKLVRATSFSGAAGKATTVAPINGSWQSIYLHGVELNPAFRMEVVDTDNCVKGLTYLAYAPALSNDVEVLYQSNLQLPETTIPYSTLFTSKFSPGGVNATPTNLKDVWAVCVNQAANEAKWKRIIRDLIITVAGGKLMVEFYLSHSSMASNYALPTAQQSSGTSINRVVATSSGTRHLNAGSQVIHLPIDPVAAASWTPATNSAGVYSQLHGRAYYTGDTLVSVTGTFTQVTPPLVYNRAVATDQANVAGNAYYGPTLTINIAGFNDSDLSNVDYYVCLEGAIQNG